MQYHWRVNSEEAGQRLDRYLKEKLQGSLSLSQVRTAIEHDCCAVNQKQQRFVSTKLQAGSLVVLRLQAQPQKLSDIQWNAANILFEDDAFFAYNKPAGITCDDKGLFLQAKNYCKKAIPLHRLDKETTGVILFGKDLTAAELVLGQFKNRLIKKKYLAIVDGVLKQKEGLICNHLSRQRTQNNQAIWTVTSCGLYAETSWRTLAQGHNASYIACYPQTGRTHQIRVHLSDLGHPILGDPLYLRKSYCSYKPQRLMLHATSLQWHHPLTQERIAVESAIPADMLEVIAYIKDGHKIKIRKI